MEKNNLSLLIIFLVCQMGKDKKRLMESKKEEKEKLKVEKKQRIQRRKYS